MVPDAYQNAAPSQHFAPSYTNATHSRTRTSSSTLFPANGFPSAAPTISSTQPTPQYATAPNQPPLAPGSYASMISQYKPAARRTLSNATNSTSTTGTGGHAVRTSSIGSEHLRRSGSSRSSHSPGGYVALMRKQKATVWCDRSQHEDPRIMAQQKAAKLRAAQEVVSGAGAIPNTGSAAASGSLMSRSKIRHHVKPTTLG